MSSRVRLARNVKGYPFYHWAGKKERADVLSAIKKGLDASKYMKNELFISMDNLDEVDKLFLVERHLMSREHASWQYQIPFAAE